MIFCHESPEYIKKREAMAYGKHNGAYYYSKEITSNIIPNVETDRNWVTVNVEGNCWDHSIVFIHKNVDIDQSYGWLSDYKDLVLVCSNHETRKHMEKYGKAIFLPLSIDVDFVKQFKYDGPKSEIPCYVGNRWSFKTSEIEKYLPGSYNQLTNLPREELLKKLAQYKTVYAIGRCAVEAKLLGAEVKVCDSRYPDPEFWNVVDNFNASQWLQDMLDEIDRKDDK